MTDPISDMLTRMRNAGSAGHQTVSIPYSRLKSGILRVFKKENIIDGFEKKGKKTKKHLVVRLRYSKSGSPYISGLERVSKPGRRVYKKSSEIFSVRQGYGTMILSTSDGLMTNKEARQKKVGGEVICKVW